MGILYLKGELPVIDQVGIDSVPHIWQDSVFQVRADGSQIRVIKEGDQTTRAIYNAVMSAIEGQEAESEPVLSIEQKASLLAMQERESQEMKDQQAKREEKIPDNKSIQPAKENKVSEPATKKTSTTKKGK